MYGRELSVLERIESNVLKWFRNVERMGKNVYHANMKDNRGRSQRRWREDLKWMLLGRGFSEREGIVLVRGREASSRMVYRSG